MGEAQGSHRTGEKKFSPALFYAEGRYPMLETGIAIRYRCIPVRTDEDPFPVCHPSQEELDTLGNGFTCVSCLRRRPKRQFGGYRAGEKLCRFCYFFADDDDIRGWLVFDRNHGHI